MIEFISRIDGWPRVAYDFACSFVHLSNLHGYRPESPLAALETADRERIVDYLRRYHGAPTDENPSAGELLILAESVLEKITGNINCYLEDLEARTPPEQVF